VKALFDLKSAPFRMIARGLKLWLYAELDNFRLTAKRLFASTPEPMPEKLPDA
jgi:hypothetical protein